MKYQDDLSKGYVNAQYAGKRVGKPTPDALAPASDGYDHLRATEHVGTVTQDAKTPGYPAPVVPEPEE